MVALGIRVTELPGVKSRQVPSLMPPRLLGRLVRIVSQDSVRKQAHSFSRSTQCLRYAQKRISWLLLSRRRGKKSSPLLWNSMRYRVEVENSMKERGFDDFASYPPSPRSREAQLELNTEACSHEVLASCELLKAEVRAVRSQDKFSRSTALRIRSERTPPLLLSRPGLKLIQNSGTRIRGGYDRFLTTRSAAPLPRGEWIYFEFLILNTKCDIQNTIELALGLAPADTPLCGQSPGSVGLLSLGGLLLHGKWISATLLGLPFDDTSNTHLFFRPGDIVGILARQDNSRCQLRFNVNGMLLLHGNNHTLTHASSANSLFEPLTLSLPQHNKFRRRRERASPTSRLYPTVSFRTPGVTVQTRFTAEDIQKPYRANIGAPPNTRVYAIDGTPLF